MEENKKQKLKLWFFRDLSDDQRLSLFGLHGLCLNELTTHVAQMKAFDWLLGKSEQN